MDHKNIMCVLNNEYEDRKSICERLYKIYKSNDFIWCNQSYTSLASSLFKLMRGYLPESQYDTKTREVVDDFYPRALQWCSTDPAPDNLVSLDVSKCYPSILIDNASPIPLYSIHDIIEPFNGVFKTGEYYIDEFVIDKQLGNGVKIEAGFYSGLTCSSLDTAQCIWTSARAENSDVVIDSYQYPNTKQELYLIRERQIKRIFSDNTSINRFVISQSILKCLNMLHDNASHDNDSNGISQVYAINTDGVFMTNPKN